MHRVLQLNHIGGKNCLAEEEHQKALMDILNLLSEKAQSGKEAEAVPAPAQKQEELPEIIGEDLQQDVTSEAKSISEEEHPGEDDNMQAEQMAEQEVLTAEDISKKGDIGEIQGVLLGKSEDDCGKVPTWYYCPNGALIKR